MNISTSNYNKPTPKWLKIVADLGLVLIPFLTTAQMECPEFPGKEWVFYGLITGLSLFKLISKFIADERASQ